jgi:hypothetical protein
MQCVAAILNTAHAAAVAVGSQFLSVAMKHASCTKDTRFDQLPQETLYPQQQLHRFACVQSLHRVAGTSAAARSNVSFLSGSNKALWCSQCMIIGFSPALYILHLPLVHCITGRWAASEGATLPVHLFTLVRYCSVYCNSLYCNTVHSLCIAIVCTAQAHMLQMHSIVIDRQ